MVITAQNKVQRKVSMKKSQVASVCLALGVLLAICTIDQVVFYLLQDQIISFVNQVLWRALLVAAAGLTLSGLAFCAAMLIVKRVFFSYLCATDKDMEEIEKGGGQ